MDTEGTYRQTGHDNKAYEDIELTGIQTNTNNVHSSKVAENLVKDPDAIKKVESVSPIDQVFNFCADTYSTYNKQILIGFYVLLLLCYIGYFIYVLYYNLSDDNLGFDKVVEIVSITAVAVGLTIYFTFLAKYGDSIYEKLETPLESIEKQWYWLKWVCYFVIFAGFILILFVALKLHETPENLISGGGLFCFVLFGYLFSRHPTKIIWRPVIWGLSLQFIFALLILRTTPGYVAFQWLGDFFTTFLAFTDAGSEFVFGANYEDHFFAFKVLPVIIFFSSVVSILYYLGVLQAIVKRIAWLMSFTMQTSAAESLNAAGNIFIGQTEAPLMIAPYLSLMTKSELHAVLTGGFSTVAGSVLGAYIGFGVNASHLISASVMSAPAALALSKLMYPETEESHTKTIDDVQLPKGPERNIVEAASNGASNSVKLVANIAVNLIAFLAVLEGINALLGWIGGMAGYPELSFEVICSYVFMPLAYVMGVAWEDCGEVAELIGLKTFLNEFIAYEKLGVYIEEGTLTPRSEVIATYAICGFANFGSIGICIGGLGALAPSKKSDVAEVAVRAMVAGTCASFMTACIAGFLLTPDDLDFGGGNQTVNGTMFLF